MTLDIVSLVADIIGPCLHIRLIRPTTMLSNIDNFCMFGFHCEVCLVICHICIRTDCKAQIEMHFSGPLFFFVLTYLHNHTTCMKTSPDTFSVPLLFPRNHISWKIFILVHAHENPFYKTILFPLKFLRMENFLIQTL